MEISNKQLHAIVKKELQKFTSSIKDSDIDKSIIDVIIDSKNAEDTNQKLTTPPSLDPLSEQRSVTIIHVC